MGRVICNQCGDDWMECSCPGDMNPNFGELMADLRILWDKWNHEQSVDVENDNHSRASTKRMCMEDIERLIEKYGELITNPDIANAATRSTRRDFPRVNQTPRPDQDPTDAGPQTFG